MSELMVLQQEYIDWLNQSKAHQCLPFIVLSTITLISLALLTKISVFYVLIITYNPISLIAYFFVGVAFFTTMPALLFLIIVYFVAWSLRAFVGVKAIGKEVNR